MLSAHQLREANPSRLNKMTCLEVRRSQIQWKYSPSLKHPLGSHIIDLIDLKTLHRQYISWIAKTLSSEQPS
ncbi:uncharacterized protein AKAW2_30458S [Aspergillus luchuensis]|uniref:Uncharacterized protein n=1 Tax=Aspergillus kawachii TaxID=1069201 RepID=A0A7R7W6B0_ASPKA|nr:uncharacterized protein AKAW2_30458S [Aspergillus luchuensis]BCR97139.1 hypothetical protein AKAW2_30458S [Aspergillus luchuensis]